MKFKLKAKKFKSNINHQVLNIATYRQAYPGLKFIRIITFSFIQFLSLPLCFVYMVVIKLKKKPNNKQKTSLQSYKTQIKVLLFPGLA